MVCASRIDLATLRLISTATGASIQHSLLYLGETKDDSKGSVCGICESYEMKTFGNQSYHIFSGCTGGVATILLRGGATSLLAEVFILSLPCLTS